MIDLGNDKYLNPDFVIFGEKIDEDNNYKIYLPNMTLIVSRDIWNQINS